ncbi:MAG TPA: cytochrome c-type biogenesis protein [Thermodesulfobacteriota bacterium]|nr:cytochrome c-type biogenesis protein [Thermodesulfobacteriota bacterium]
MPTIENRNIAAIFTLLFLIFLPGISTAESLDDRVNEIAHLLMCPVCQGQSVAESNSNLAQDMRQIIRKQLEEGKSKEEVIAYFVNRYGETILASPPPRGVNWLLWLLPGLAIVFGALGIGIYLKSQGSKSPADSGKRTEKTAADSDYMHKIDEELKKRES